MSSTDIFNEEHRTLDHHLADVEFLADRRSYVTAAKRFGEVRRHLERHLNEEEQVLFPFYVERTNDADGVVAQMRLQHTEILAALEGVAAALTAADHCAFDAEVARLGQLLRAHQVSEEQLLHPALDRLLQTEVDWDALCRRATLGIPFHLS
jgi:iron-sulfur cluster repair protein YtfE (RIC family)